MLVVAFIFRPDSSATDDQTPDTQRAAWVLSRIDGSGPTVRLEFDQETGWTRVVDPRLPGPMFFIDERVVVQMPLSSLTVTGKNYVSIPVQQLFPSAITFSPAQIAASLARTPKECTFPSPAEDAYIRLFFGKQSLDLTSSYTICGSGVFANGSGRDLFRADEQLLEDAFETPPFDEAMNIEDMGELGTLILSAVRETLS